MKRSRLVPLAAGVALLVLIVLGVVWLWPGGPDQEQVAETAPAVEEEPPAGEVETPVAAVPDDEAPPVEVEEAPAVEPEPEPEPAEPEPEVAEPQPPAPEVLAQEPDEPEVAGDQPDQALEPLPPAGVAPLGPEEAEAVAEVEPDDTSTAPADTAAAQDLGCADGATACALAQDILNTVEQSADGAPEILLNKPDGVYVDQEYLVVEVAMPSDFGGYLYLDVLTEAGEVFHLLPEPLREDNRLDAGAMIRVGVEEDERAAGVRHWQVAAPFGPGYLVALASEDPIYDGLRPVGESLDAYRSVLLEGLSNGTAGGQAVQVVPIEFRAN